MGNKTKQSLLTVVFATACWTAANAQPFVTISLVPIGGTTVQGGSVVTIEAFLTVNADSCPGTVGATNPDGIRVEGGQIDLPCILPGGTSGTIQIVDPGGAGGATTDPDGDGLRGPSSGGIGFIFGAGGLGPYAPATCIIANTPGVGSPPQNLNVGQTRYLGTYFYQVSDCAVGDFNALFEGVTHPPLATNTTRFRDDCPAQTGQGPLLDLNTSAPTLTVPSGRCCDASTCLGELNETCCLNIEGGSSWTAGATCANGCPCTSPSECNDDNPCTADACTNNLCVNTPLTGACDDGLFCTVNDTCVDSACQGVANPCGGLLCNEDLNACVQCRTADDCASDNNDCTDDVCNPQGTCEYPIDDTNTCDDGLFCSRTDKCENGVCVQNTPRVCPVGQICCEDFDACRVCCNNADCNDQNVCTDDFCNEPAGTCSNTPASGPCDDGLFCTFLDACAGGQCVGGATNPCQVDEICLEATDECVECEQAEDCNDDNSCTSDSCDGGRCVNTPEGAGTVCGNPEVGPCDNRDVCDGLGNCSPNLKPDGTNCNDQLFCNGADECVNGVCKSEGNPCPSNQFCNETTDMCEDAAPCISPTECPDDNNPCTGVACETGRCVYPPNTSTCDDGDGCTVGDACSGGVCVPGAPRDCNDSNVCTTDSCAAGVCVNQPVTVGTACGSNANTDCDNPDTCNALGQCQSNNEPNGTACTSDGNECTQDICNGGVCTNPPAPAGTACGSNSNTDCDNPDTCNGAGVCQSNNESPGTPCTTDGNECTADVCAAGVCTHPNQPTGTACGSSATSDCDNRDTCNGSGVCQGNTLPDGSTCSTDGNDCTSDVCAAGLCTHPNLPAGAACGSQANTDCDNPNTCNGTGICQSNNEPEDTVCASDNNDCTQDVCRGGQCAHPPLAAGTACGDPTENACNHADTCNGAGVCNPNLEANGASCTNGLFCDGAETCQSGTCRDNADPCRSPAHCDETNDACFACIADNECLDINECTLDTCTNNVCLNTPIDGCVSGLGQRLSTTQKGSLLIFSKVELVWEVIGPGRGGAGYDLVQDTFLTLTNDYPADVNIQLYFINGDEPIEAECDPACFAVFGRCIDQCIIEREHPGWNWMDCSFRLTANQPTYWSAHTGLPAGCQPWENLDPGSPPGRPDPERPGLRVLRGYVIGWAVDRDGREIHWNHLSGNGLVVDYLRSTAWEYNAYAAAAIGGEHGLQTDGTPGQMNLDGREYDNAWDRLLFDFYAVNSGAFDRAPEVLVRIDTDITLHAVSADLRQETTGPVTTKATYDIWNENERRFSEMTRCVTCWDQTLASNYGPPNYFNRLALQTNKGKARIDGLASQNCPNSIEAALLGLTVKELTFGIAGQALSAARSAITMIGTSTEEATILYDLPSTPEELYFNVPMEQGTQPLAPRTVKPSGGK